LSGQRFPWGNTIDWSHANYYSYWVSGAPSFSYDLAPTSGYDPAFNDGVYPYTSPVGSFAANGYGLCDMAGNLFEWYWDLYGTPYCQPTNNNPTEPATGSNRVVRGSLILSFANSARCAYRDYYVPSFVFYPFAFRCVRGL
jgi:formylglycine-generating enzyme required for sulfatase activity